MSAVLSRVKSAIKPGLCAAAVLLFLFSALPVSAQDPSGLVQAVNDAFNRFRGIQSYVELELIQPGKPSQNSFAQLAFVPEGGKLYFKTFSPLTPHYFTLISKEGLFWLQLPKSKTIFTGPLEAIGQNDFELKVSPMDFQKMFVPTAIEAKPGQVNVRDEGQFIVLEIQGDVQQTQQTFKEREIWLTKQGYRPARDVRFSLNGNPYMEIRWEEPGKTEEGTPFPQTITLFKPQTGYQLRLRLKKSRLSNEVPKDLFEILDVSGYKIERVNP